MLEVSRPEQSIDTSQLSALSSENYRGFVQNALNLITSGEIARRFGHQYDQKGLLALFLEMETNVKEVLPQPQYVDPLRQKTLEEMTRSLKDLLLSGIIRSRSEMPDLNPIVPSLKKFFYSQLFSLKRIPPGFSFQSKVVYETKTSQNAKADFFRYEPRNQSKEKNRIYAETNVTNPVLPVAQEELFHAVQELCMGNVSNIAELDKRIIEASKHVTHISLVLDRVLSAAAAELGRDEFEYWAGRANNVTKDFKDKFVGKIFSNWENTPLGKEVNKRFRYPIADPREIGAQVAHLSLDLEKFLFDKNGNQIGDNFSLFEIISIQFGNLQKELGFQMIDLVDTEVEKLDDYQKIGRKIIEWGKRVLKFYKGKKEEDELVTHHTHIETKLDSKKYEFQITHKLVEKLNNCNFSIPTSHINFFTLTQITRETYSERLNEFVNLCFPKDETTFVEPDWVAIKQFGINRKDLMQLVERAKRERQRAINNIKIVFPRKSDAIMFFTRYFGEDDF